MSFMHFETEEDLRQASQDLPSRRLITPTGGRRHVRCEAHIALTLRDEFGWGPVELKCADVSASGLFVRSDLLFREGEGYLLEFETPITNTKITVWSRVARVAFSGRQSTSGDAGMAFEFVDIPERYARELDMFAYARAGRAAA